MPMKYSGKSYAVMWSKVLKVKDWLGTKLEPSPPPSFVALSLLEPVGQEPHTDQHLVGLIVPGSELTTQPVHLKSDTGIALPKKACGRSTDRLSKPIESNRNTKDFHKGAHMQAWQMKATDWSRSPYIG